MNPLSKMTNQEMAKMTNQQITNKINRLEQDIEITKQASRESDPGNFFKTQFQLYESNKSRLENFKKSRKNGAIEKFKTNLDRGIQEKNAQLESIKTTKGVIRNGNYSHSMNVRTKEKQAIEQNDRNLHAIQTETDELLSRKKNLSEFKKSIRGIPNDNQKEEYKEKLKLLRGIDAVLFDDNLTELSDDYPSSLLFLLDVEQLLVQNGTINKTKLRWFAVTQYETYKEFADKVQDMEKQLQEVSSRSLSKQIEIWKQMKDIRISEKMDGAKSRFAMFSKEKSFVGLCEKEQARRMKEMDVVGYESYLKRLNEYKDDVSFIKAIDKKFRYLEKISSNRELRFFAILILCLILKLKGVASSNLFDTKDNLNTVVNGVRIEEFKSRLESDKALLDKIREKINSSSNNQDASLSILLEIFNLTTNKEYVFLNGSASQPSKKTNVTLKVTPKVVPKVTPKVKSKNYYRAIRTRRPPSAPMSNTFIAK